ncbi:MAG: hypothetical protein U5K75_02225 [Ahrensia sp.]|nr:hypothetical protein [Ahrensia sp.]
MVRSDCAIGTLVEAYECAKVTGGVGVTGPALCVYRSAENQLLRFWAS